MMLVLRLYRVERVVTAYALAASETEARRLVSWDELGPGDCEEDCERVSPGECSCMLTVSDELIFHGGEGDLSLGEAARIALRELKEEGR